MRIKRHDIHSAHYHLEQDLGKMNILGYFHKLIEYLTQQFRFCIGQRLGQLQTKVGLALLLDKFEFNFCSMSEYPIKIEPLNLVYGPSGDVWLNVKECCSNN